MKYSAVIAGGGTGSRMNLGFNKIFCKRNGRTVIEDAMSLFIEDRDCTEVILVCDEEDYRRHVKGEIPPKLRIVKGGGERQDSVACGLALVQEAVVMIHDGARPDLEKESLDCLKDAMTREKAALLAVLCKDTIKVVKDGYVKETLTRSSLRAAQTPQAFDTQLLRECFAKAAADGYYGTDDASVVERYSDVPVAVVAGTYSNRKITTPDDL